MVRMRIITGSYKGRKLSAPKGESVRPTSDRVREYIFSVLGEKINGAAVLDLFAGSGAMGLEAKSRGAAEVVFVDISRLALESVRRNCEMIRFPARIIKGDAVKVLDGLNEAFDLIFCDPPYQYPLMATVLQKIRELNRIKPDGLLLYESSARNEAPEVKGWQITRSKKMGDTQVIFYHLE